MAYHADFEIDIITALSGQLIESLESLEPGALDREILDNDVDTRQGVYQLFLDGDLVYVGKADNLRKRLKEHHTKISGRNNITVNRMGFKCLYIHPNWTALAPEHALIKHYQSEWNGNGFGPHDPGRERETTKKPPQGFDARYPIKDDWPCNEIEPGPWNARELLLAMKETLPYLLRFEVKNNKKYRDGHPAYNNIQLNVPTGGITARNLLALVAENIPGAQATIFPSHMILYMEERDYPHGEIIWPKS